jgi:hypothetical protein
LSKDNIAFVLPSVNFLPIDKGITVTPNQNFFSFAAEPLGKTLGDVTVTAKKPLIRQEE